MSDGGIVQGGLSISHVPNFAGTIQTAARMREEISFRVLRFLVKPRPY